MKYGLSTLPDRGKATRPWQFLSAESPPHGLGFPLHKPMHAEQKIGANERKLRDPSAEVL